MREKYEKKGGEALSRTEKALKNVKLALAAQLVTLLASFVSRRFFTHYLSVEYLGLSGLFSNVLTVLSLAELGVGASITYSLYRPIAEGDRPKTAALMRLFKKLYTIIGIVVFVLGCLATPLLRFFVDDIEKTISAIPEFYLIYILYVVNSSVSYFFTYKKTLIIADQKKYITSYLSAISSVALSILECVILALTRNYVLFMVVTVVITICENVAASLIASKLYPYLLDKSACLDDGDMAEIKTNVGASLLHNIGGVIVNGTDNILISRLVGFAAEGIYSNYHLISAAVDSMLRPIFLGISSSFGDLAVDCDNEKKTSVFQSMFFIGAWLYGFCAICMLALYQPFISLWLGDEYLLSETAVIFIALNFYLLGMRRPGMVAREAMGLLRYDKWKSISEAAINLVFSILLAGRFGIVGILAGTAISSLSTCFWIEPIVLYRHGFCKSAGGFFKRYAAYTAVSMLALALTIAICGRVAVGGIFGFVIRAAVCAVVPNLIFILMYNKTKEYRYCLNILKQKINFKRK